MIPQSVEKYLRRYSIRYDVLNHPVAITAQELAEAVDVSGHRVAKSVLVDLDGTKCLVVLPASERVDPARLAHELGCRNARICTEDEVSELFPDCELGAEPPFGRLYGLPVIVDDRLANADRIVFNAGTHLTAIRMSYAALDLLENPRIARFGVPFESHGMEAP